MHRVQTRQDTFHSVSDVELPDRFQTFDGLVVVVLKRGYGERSFLGIQLAALEKEELVVEMVMQEAAEAGKGSRSAARKVVKVSDPRPTDVAQSPHFGANGVGLRRVGQAEELAVADQGEFDLRLRIIDRLRRE